MQPRMKAAHCTIRNTVKKVEKKLNVASDVIVRRVIEKRTNPSVARECCR